MKDQNLTKTIVQKLPNCIFSLDKDQNESANNINFN